jgi:predicted dehydrogenase
METRPETLSRRSFLKKSSAVGAGAATLTIIKPELVRGAGKEMLKAGLIGCGGRGTEAAANLLTGDPNVELVSMGDIFEDRLERSLAEMRKTKVAARIKVPPDHHFVGFDAYEKVLKSDIDIVMLCTPPGYRPIHFEAAIAAKKHVFCEKPFGTDPVGVQRFMDAAKKSEEMKLTVVSGAQRRFARDYQGTVEKIQNGTIGDVAATYAYWVGSPVLQFQGGGWPGPKGKRDPKWSDMVWQNRSWYSFVWICGDQIVEQHLHNIDVCNWVMGTHPVKVFASGGVVWRPGDEEYGNIYDHIDAEFEYANGVHMTSHCRQYPEGSYENVSELIVGTKGRSNGHDLGGGSGQDVRGGFRNPLDNPYVREHMALVSSIRGDGPYINHAMTVAESTMTCIMAREAAYSGQAITWDQMMASKLDLTPKAFGYDEQVAVPPRPVPGQYKFM